MERASAFTREDEATNAPMASALLFASNQWERDKGTIMKRIAPKPVPNLPIRITGKFGATKTVVDPRAMQARDTDPHSLTPFFVAEMLTGTENRIPGTAMSVAGRLAARYEVSNSCIKAGIDGG
jgi:hypothetical protein